MMRNRVTELLVSPFCSEGGLNKPLIVVFVLINGIVLFNAIFHDPGVQYDAKSHQAYIQVLSEFRLPTREDTREFFSPPLPYVLPSLLYSTDMFSIQGASKFSQLLNVLFSVGLTFYLLKICDLIRPNDSHFKVISLALLGMLPVYYKTFAFARGEPLVALLSVFVTYQTLTIFLRERGNRGRIMLLGVSLGLLILARQWGLLMIPAIVIFVAILVLRHKQGRSFFGKAIVAVLTIASITGGWFYLHLYKEYGTMTAFNRASRPTFSFSNQPLEFYFGLGLDKVFTDPIRQSFTNQFLPLFYSDTWGDYWCYFIVYGKDVRDGRLVSRVYRELSRDPAPWWLQTNRYTINRYLGRVNLMSLFPSAVLLAGTILGMIYSLRFVSLRPANDRIIMCSLLWLIVVISFAGYFWFLIMYPNRKGDTIKAAYMIHLLPFISILSGELLERVRQKSVRAYWVALALLSVSLLHNSPVLITRYISWPWG